MRPDSRKRENPVPRPQFLETMEPRVLFAAGALDNTFSGDGRVTLSNFEMLTAGDVAVQPDGKTVIVGSLKDSTSGTRQFFATARLNVDGTLDAGFGTAGFAFNQLRECYATAVAIALLGPGRYSINQR